MTLIIYSQTILVREGPFLYSVVGFASFARRKYERGSVHEAYVEVYKYLVERVLTFRPTKFSAPVRTSSKVPYDSRILDSQVSI